jgi:DNA polymerase III sliding clamp (beta) subunit (PCNA family)
MIKLKQSDLLDIVSRAYLFADTTKIAEIPHNLVKVENSNGKLVATCSNVGVIASFSAHSDCDTEFSFAVNAYKLFDIVKNWSVSEEINFQISEGRITLKAKNKKINISCVPDEGYWTSRAPNESSGFACGYDEIKKAIERSSFCASKTAYDVTQRCLLIESMEDSSILLASNEGYRLASIIHKNDTLFGSFRILVDAETIRSSMRHFAGDEIVNFSVSNSRLDIFNSRHWIGIATVPAKYPDVFRVRNMRYPYTYSANAEDIMAVCKSVLSVIRNSDRPRHARVLVSESSLTFYASTDEGDIEESVPLGPISGKSIEDLKGCDVIYFSEPASFFKNLIFETGPEKKHGYIFTSEEEPAWVYHLVATK